MKIEGRLPFNAPPETVWKLLLDPEVMARCIPGCQELKEVGPDEYSARLKVGVGPVSGAYSGRIRITEQQPTSRYVMAVDATGAQGFVKGSGEIVLEPVGTATAVVYRCDLEVGGPLMSVGHRMLEGVGTFLVKQMFSRLQSQAEGSASR